MSLLLFSVESQRNLSILVNLNLFKSKLYWTFIRLYAREKFLIRIQRDEKIVLLFDSFDPYVYRKITFVTWIFEETRK